jgi:hypothetical protein
MVRKLINGRQLEIDSGRVAGTNTLLLLTTVDELRFESLDALIIARGCDRVAESANGQRMAILGQSY